MEEEKVDAADDRPVYHFICYYEKHPTLKYTINTYCAGPLDAALQFVYAAMGLGWPRSYNICVAELVGNELRPAQRVTIVTSYKATLVQDKPVKERKTRKKAV